MRLVVSQGAGSPSAVRTAAGVVRGRHVAAPGVAPRLDDLLIAVEEQERGGVTRRQFILTAIALSIAVSLPRTARGAEAAAPPRNASAQATTLDVQGNTSHNIGLSGGLKVEF